MDYTLDDIQVIDDAVQVIRRNPTLYGGDPPRGARLAAAMMSDLISHGDLPASVENIEGWWLVVCGLDWLKQDNGKSSTCWSRIVSTPEVGVNSMRSEVVIAALSQALVSGSAQRLEWIVRGAELPKTLRTRLNETLDGQFAGRVVAFLAE